MLDDADSTSANDDGDSTVAETAAERSERLLASSKRSNASARAAMSVDGTVWVAADSIGGEYAAQDAIRALGFECFVLSLPERVRTERNRNVYKMIMRPAVSRLIFIGVDGSLEAVLEAFKAHHATPLDDRPGAPLVIVSPSELRDFADRNTPRERDIAQLAILAERFRTGDRVTVDRGPFADRPGDVVRSYQDRVVVDLAMFGTTVHAHVAVDDLREAV